MILLKKIKTTLLIYYQILELLPKTIELFAENLCTRQCILYLTSYQSLKMVYRFFKWIMLLSNVSIPASFIPTSFQSSKYNNSSGKISKNPSLNA